MFISPYHCTVNGIMAPKDCSLHILCCRNSKLATIGIEKSPVWACGDDKWQDTLLLISVTKQSQTKRVIISGITWHGKVNYKIIHNVLS